MLVCWRYHWWRGYLDTADVTDTFAEVGATAVGLLPKSSWFLLSVIGAPKNAGVDYGFCKLREHQR